MTEAIKLLLYSNIYNQHFFSRPLEFNAGDRLIIRIVNNDGSNTNHSASVNGTEVDV